jgi:hypothetical protein
MEARLKIVQWLKADISNNFSDCATIGDLIRRLDETAMIDGEVICEVRINGSLLSEANELERSKDLIATVATVEVRTQDPRLLVEEAISTLTQFIPILEQSAISAAEEIRNSGLRSSSQQMTELIDGCSWVVETVAQIRGARTGLGISLPRSERWYEAEKSLASTVREVHQAMTQRDLVHVADVIEYDLTTSLQIWREVLVL